MEALLAHLALPLGGGVVRVKEHLAPHGDAAPVGTLQEVEAAQEGGLAGAGGADDGHGLPLLQGKADILQNPRPAESLLDILYL